MTQDELMELARECGATVVDLGVAMTNDQLAKFAALVAARKKEQCAKVCDAAATGEGDEAYAEGAVYCAAAIRAMKD